MQDPTQLLDRAESASCKASRGVYGRLLTYLHPYRRSFGLALFCMLIFGASDGGVPFLVKHILDGVFAKQDRSLLLILPLIVLGFALALDPNEEEE